MRYTDMLLDPFMRRLYYAWGNMKKRCKSPNLHNSKYYYELDITYSPDWENFENFARDMKDSYRPGLFLDRINGSVGYCKENCRWVTLTESNRNRSSVNLSLEIAEEIRVLYKTGLYTQKELGVRYGASREAVKDVLAGKTWQQRS